MRRAKTLIIGLLTVVLLAGLVLSPGCARPEVSGVEYGQEKPLIAVVLQYATIDWAAPLHAGMMDAAEEYGVDTVFLGPASWDIMDVISIIETLLAQGEMDGLVVEAIPPSALYPIVKRVQDELGIPVVLTNELVEHELYDGICGVDSEAVGELYAEIMISEMLGEGIWAKAVGYEGTGEVEGKIVYLRGDMASRNEGIAIDRTREILSQSQFPGIIDLGQFEGTPDKTIAREVMTNILTANPDLAGMITGECASAIGAAMAAEEMGLTGEIVIIGIDLYPQGLELIQSGQIAAIVDQGVYQQGYLPVEAIAKYLLYDTPIPHWMPTDILTVTIENVDEVIERETGFVRGWEGR